MKTKITVLLFGILVTNVSFGQVEALFVELASIDPKSSDEDLRNLDTYFEDVQIVGLGESTHGTHEFSIMRHRIFQYLVEHHDFNTFFLEADYASCLRVNNYINGAQDDVYDALDEIDMWPWLTTEMIDLIKWMRNYNAGNPANRLNFVGIDAQRFSTTLKAIDRVLEKYSLSKTDTLRYPPLTDTEFMVLKKKKDLAPYNDLLLQKENIDTLVFSEVDRKHYAILLRHFRQTVEMQNEKKSRDRDVMRDIHMAKNILAHITSDEDKRAVFWAHNGHIFNLSLNEFGTEKWSGCAGGYLKETIGDKYFSLGFDFDEGTFNAYYPNSESDIVLEKKKYTLGAVTIGPSVDGTLAANHRHLKSPLFIDYSQIEGDEPIWMNFIGAAYFPGNEDNLKSTARYNMLGNKTSFDAMILIKETTATHLLRNEKPQITVE